MPSLRTIFTLGALSTIFTHIIATEPSNDRRGGTESVGDNSVPFQDLLNSVPEDHLHAALHQAFPLKYKHGVFQEDRTALEALHRDNADVATRVVELAKRQTNSTARASSSNRASSTPANNPSTTTRAGQSSTAVASSQASTSGVQTSLTAGGTLTTTDASGSSGVRTLSAGSVVTSTDSAGNVVTVTVDPIADSSSTAAAQQSSGSITSTVIQTTTLSNGARSTVTAVTIVAGAGGSAGQTPSGTAGAPPASTTAGSSGLQAGSAVSRMGKEVLALVIGALLLAMAMQY